MGPTLDAPFFLPQCAHPLVCRVRRFSPPKKYCPCTAKRLEHRADHHHAPEPADSEGHDRGVLHPPAPIEHLLGVPQGAAAEQGQNRLLRWQELHRQVLQRLG